MNDRPASSDSPNQILLAAWQRGDQSAAATLFNRYLVRLTALVRSRLSNRLARRVDPDDVILSAYRSFFVAAGDGRIAVPEDDDLWPLLVVLVLRKLSRAAERHTAARRDAARETDLNSVILGEAIATDPTPDQAALLEDELSDILGQLASREREVVSQRLQGESERDIAQRLGCSERTVRRALEHVRQIIVQRGGVGDVTWPQPMATHDASRQTASAADDSAAEISDWQSVSYGDLRLEKLIGAGGMAKLYRAAWLSAGRPVAVKFLRKRFWTNRRAVTGLLDEARTLQRLRHPQIVPLLGTGQTREGVPFLVLPWIDGENFDQWRIHTTPSVEQVAAVMRSVLPPVAAAHTAGLVHCDLKPANLLIDGRGQTFLTDFGFARSIRADVHPRLRGGTVAFLAPEQCSDVFGPIGPHTDVYGWGATLYDLLCGRPPYLAGDVPGIIAQIVSARPPDPPSKFRSEVPAWLDALLLRCLANEPELRPSLTEIAELTAALCGQGARR